MELRDYHNNLAFRIVGDRCYDTKGVAVYVLKGNYFYDASGNWRLMIDGSRVYDSQDKWVYNISKGHDSSSRLPAQNHQQGTKSPAQSYQQGSNPPAQSYQQSDKPLAQSYQQSDKPLAQSYQQSDKPSAQSSNYGDRQRALGHHASQPAPLSSYASPQPDSHAGPQPVKSVYPSPQPNPYAGSQSAKSPNPSQPGSFASQPQGPYASQTPVQNRYQSNQPPIQNHHHNSQPPAQSHYHSNQPHGLHYSQAPSATPPQQNYPYGHQPKKRLNLKVIIPIAVAVVLGVALTIVLISGRGGGTRSHPAVGQWHSTVDDYMMVIFHSDGTGVLFDDGHGVGFTWSADSGIMTAIFNDEGYIWREVHRYSLQGQLLHFTYLSGEDDELEWPSPWRRN